MSCKHIIIVIIFYYYFYKSVKMKTKYKSPYSIANTVCDVRHSMLNNKTIYKSKMIEMKGNHEEGSTVCHCKKAVFLFSFVSIFFEALCVFIINAFSYQKAHNAPLFCIDEKDEERQQRPKNIISNRRGFKG